MGNIKVEVTNSGPCERTLSVKVAAEEFGVEREKIVQKFRKEARIPGFRPGKVPRSLIEKRYSDSIKAETIESLINSGFRQALEQEKINPLTHPVVDKVDVAEDLSVSFEAKVEIFPEISLERYTGFTVEKKLPEVTEAALDRALENVREQQARFAPKEGEAEKGDYLVMDFCVLGEDGQPDAGTRREQQLVMAGHEDPTALFSHALVGIKPGEGQELEVDFPEDYPEESLKGQKIRYRLDVHSLRQRVLPELDDSFAREISTAPDMKGLREILRKNMEHENEHHAEHQVEEDLFRNIIEANSFDLPASLIEDAVARRADYVRQQNRGQDIDETELRNAVRAGAITSLRREFIIHELSHKEKIEVNADDIAAKIEMYASQLGKPIEEVQKDFRSAKTMNQLRSMLLEDKVLAFLKDNNEIKTVATRTDGDAS